MNRRTLIAATGAALATSWVPAAVLAMERPTGPLIVTLNADLSEFQKQADELVSLRLEAGELPESVLTLLNGLLDKLGDELVFSGPVSTRGAREQVISLRFREGGKFDSCMAALRALRDGDRVGHGGLR